MASPVKLRFRQDDNGGCLCLVQDFLDGDSVLSLYALEVEGKQVEFLQLSDVASLHSVGLAP